MHARGINMRYLGTIATKIKEMGGAPSYVEKLFLMEMVSRAAKYLLRRTMAHTPTEWMGPAIAHFLNCYLVLSNRERERERERKKKRKGKRRWTNQVQQIVY